MTTRLYSLFFILFTSLYSTQSFSLSFDIAGQLAGIGGYDDFIAIKNGTNVQLNTALGTSSEGMTYDQIDVQLAAFGGLAGIIGAENNGLATGNSQSFDLGEGTTMTVGFGDAVKLYDSISPTANGGFRLGAGVSGFNISFNKDVTFESINLGDIGSGLDNFTFDLAAIIDGQIGDSIGGSTQVSGNEEGIISFTPAVTLTANTVYALSLIDLTEAVSGSFAAASAGPQQFDLAGMNVSAVPVPAALWLMISGIAALFGMKRKVVSA